MSANNQQPSPVDVLRAELRRLEAKAVGMSAALEQVNDEAGRYRQAISILENGVPVRPPTSGDASPNRHAQVEQPAAASGITQLASAEKALREAGRPLRVAELLARMVAVDFPGKDPKKLRQSVTKTLDRQVERKRLLKPEPGAYSLPVSANGTANLEG